MDSIWVVRLATAVEAVRRKRKAAVRLWVGVEVEDEGIADSGGEGKREDDGCTLNIGGGLSLKALHATGSATSQKPGCWLASIDMTVTPRHERPAH